MQDKNENTLIPTHPLSVELIQKVTDNLVRKDAGSLALTSKLTLFNIQHNLTKNKAQYFSTLVAQGKQETAKKLITETGDNPLTVSGQDLLLTPAFFTDYSSRTFNCTAYEYAYWAKDTHMCRMLEQQMDEDTKAEMLKRCEAIEEHGLRYSQNGTECCTRHFDLTPLKQALQNYIDGYDNWYNTNNWTALAAAWMRVGVEQRDIPVHVVNEYCRKDRSFDPLPTFREDKLPRELTFYNVNTGQHDVPLFPLVISDSSGLGVDFALIRAGADDGPLGGGLGRPRRGTRGGGTAGAG